MGSAPKALVSSLVGILSLVFSTIFAIGPSRLNVHSGEVLVYVGLLVLGFVVIPTLCLVYAWIQIRHRESQPEQTTLDKAGILATGILGLALIGLVATFVWVSLHAS